MSVVRLVAIMEKTRSHTPNDVMIETLTGLSQRAIEAAVAELRAQDELTLAIRAMFRQGLDVDTLSYATGLRPEDIRHRLECALFIGEDTNGLFN
jgi:hypothetical protein